MDKNALPSTMKAIVADRTLTTRVLNTSVMGQSKSFGQGCEVKDVPLPTIADDDILVKVKAVALNHTDFKHIDVLSPPGSIIGCDYAGEVAEVGKKAPGQWKVGDRVAGVVHGGLYPDRGSFAEYLKVEGDLAWKIPEHIKDEEAATYGVSGMTAMLALNVRLGLPWLDELGESVKEAPTVFIYSGATSTGLYTIQLAKALGCTVVTTASPRSFDVVKKYGADRVFDYRSPTAVDEITAAFPDMTFAMDCFSEGNSSAFCAEVLKKKGGKVLTLLDQGRSKVPNVQYHMILSYILFGRPFQWLAPIGPKFEANPTARAALAHFHATLPQLTNNLKPIPISPLPGGFDGILVGLDKLRKGEVSGGKFVATF